MIIINLLCRHDTINMIGINVKEFSCKFAL